MPLACRASAAISFDLISPSLAFNVDGADYPIAAQRENGFLKLAVAVVALQLVGVTGSPAIGFASASTSIVLREQVKSGDATVHVILDPRPLPMIGFSRTWPITSAPIVVTVVTRGPTITVYARPTYGLTTKPGSYVYVSLDAKYYAPDDTRPAEPGSLPGSPMRPDIRRDSGHANLELGIGDGATLLLVAQIEDGMVSIRLRNRGGLAANLVRATHHNSLCHCAYGRTKH